MFDFAFAPHRGAPAPVLFLSGAFGVAREWNGMRDSLGPRGRSAAHDDPGAWVAALVAGPGRAHLVAHGSAAHVALRQALIRPERVLSLTLIDPELATCLPDLSAPGAPRPALRAAGIATRLAHNGAPEAAARLAVDRWMGGGAFDRSSLRLRRRFTGAMPRLLADWQRAAAAPLSLADLGRVRLPVHMITGAGAPADAVADMGRMKAWLPDARLTLVEGARGAAHLTDPHVVGPALGRAVARAQAGWQDRRRPARAA